jgi:hypothetical protein
LDPPRGDPILHPAPFNGANRRVIARAAPPQEEDA